MALKTKGSKELGMGHSMSLQSNIAEKSDITHQKSVSLNDRWMSSKQIASYDIVEAERKTWRAGESHVPVGLTDIDGSWVAQR